MSKPFVALLMAALLTTSSVRAQTLGCDEASVQGQKSAKKAKLLEARAEFSQCLKDTCAASVRDDCSAFLADVNARIPTVVFRATVDGKAATKVSVTVDGVEVAKQADGIAVDVNPGIHNFEFKTSDGRVEKVEQAILESKKGQEVHATFASAPVAASVPTPAPQQAPVADPSSSTAAPPSGSTPTMRYVGLTAAGVGGVLIIAGVVVAASGASKFNDANGTCGAMPTDAAECQSGGALGQQKSDGRSQRTLGLVLAGVGAAALTAGVVLYLVSPPGSAKEAARTGVTHVGVSPMGFSLFGRF